MKFKLRGRAQVSVVANCKCARCGDMHDRFFREARRIAVEVEAENKKDVLSHLQRNDELNPDHNREEVNFLNWIAEPEVLPFRQEDFMRQAGEPELISVSPRTRDEMNQAMRAKAIRENEVRKQCQ